ncbi:MAG: VOC family protein [Proteobacteria bacterium]|nr:VOC family protein [Pseudomonadota bacterium]HQR02906.1 VOC family protein [Rhodocyclaceae bacterium]
MGLRGINRIVIAVRDLEASKRQYADMLGATFSDAHWTGAPFGILVSIAWDAGIELCAPMPGREHDSAVSQFLARNGEGIINVFFGVDDADAAMARAAAHGYTCTHALDYSQNEIDQHLGGRFCRYQEFNLASAQRCGFGASLARLDRKSG